MGTHHRFASLEDADIIAPMNLQLIQDEGHRNPMTISQLRDRMFAWLRDEYEAVIFERDGVSVGYALFKREPEFIYLRQFFVVASHRRLGIARHALAWLWTNAWSSSPRLRIDVLVGNTNGREFWRKVGFTEYCMTMEALSPNAG
jgi:GNAT superfamily N-acetyltransferase